MAYRIIDRNKEFMVEANEQEALQYKIDRHLFEVNLEVLLLNNKLYYE